MSLKQKIGALRLVPSGGGAFEITVNGQKVYSKLATGEFPDPALVLKEIKSRL